MECGSVATAFEVTIIIEAASKPPRSLGRDRLQLVRQRTRMGTPLREIKIFSGGTILNFFE